MTQEEQKEDVVSGQVDNQDTADNTAKLFKFLLIMITLTFVITFVQNNSWRIRYDIVSKVKDDKGVMHYELYDDKNDFSFDFVNGKYKDYLFHNKEGEGFWGYTVRVQETDYVGKYLYTKQPEIKALFDSLKYQYELVFDDVNKIYEKAIIYVESYADIRDDSILELRDGMAALMTNEYVFTESNELNYGRFEFVDASDGDVLRTIQIRTR